MLYRLSKLIPVRMRSTYCRGRSDHYIVERATWWQWRDRIMRHHAKAIIPSVSIVHPDFLA